MIIKTKAKQVESYIRENIASGKWANEGRLPGESTMLAELGISRSTYREALASLSADGLIIRKFGSGIYLNSIQQTRNIAVVARATMLSSPMGYWFRDIVGSAQKGIGDSGYRPILYIGDGSTNEEFVSSISLFDKANAKDTLGVLSLIDVEPFRKELEEAGIHSVFIAGGLTYAHSVGFDDDAMMNMVVDSMLDRGYNDFCIMHHNDLSIPYSKYGMQLFTHTNSLLRRAVSGNEDRLVPVPISIDYADAYSAFKKWWDGPNRSRAIFFFDDALFDMASRAMLEMDIKVPDDLAVMTVGNVGRQFHFPTQVTQIGWDGSQLVDKAWLMLQKLISGLPVEETEIRIRPTIFEGNSL